ncbi:MAG: sporulation protein YqfD [Clostridia bacterium]|nr:sporulation protein YqfD [Clostridia bacterium]
MGFFHRRERIEIEGFMPERALLKLKRAGIPLFEVKKTQKNRILLSVNKKDIEKVFAIYPKVCYNNNGYIPYTARSLGETGVGKPLSWAKKRAGFLLGGLLFCCATLFFDSFTFGVSFVGSSVYEREARQALESYGIKPFARYASGNEDLVCSKLLALDGVEFCSVQKKGLWVRVEMRLGDTVRLQLIGGDMRARHTGEILSITALRGTPLKKAGDTVQAGDTLVGGWFSIEEGEQVSVEPIARASIKCVHEGEYEAEDAESAFARAYLALGLEEDCKVTEKTVEKRENGFFVRIAYTAVESVNL